MTKEQEEHLKHIKEDFEILITLKYRKGQAEHGGNLFDMPVLELIENSIFEAVDLVVYLLTLRENIQKGQK